MIIRHKFIGGNGLERDEAVQAFERSRIYARNYVASNLQELRRNYEGQYLAISPDVGVVDSDENKLTLIKRLQKNNDQRAIVIDTIDNLIKPKQDNN